MEAISDLEPVSRTKRDSITSNMVVWWGYLTSLGLAWLFVIDFGWFWTTHKRGKRSLYPCMRVCLHRCLYEVNMYRWILYFGQKTRRTVKEMIRRNSVQISDLQNYHSSGECSKPGHFLNKQEEFCARERCQIDSPRDWTLLFIHRTGTAQTAALQASPQCLINISQPCSGGTTCWGEKVVQSLHVLSILGLTAEIARQGIIWCKLI